MAVVGELLTEVLSIAALMVWQYNAPGFLKNWRQHRQFGLAALEIAQVGHGDGETLGALVVVVHTCQRTILSDVVLAALFGSLETCRRFGSTGRPSSDC